MRDPRVDFKIMQGVTTDVVGNCGAGVAPANDDFRQYYPAGMGPILGESDLPWSTTAEYFAAVEAARPACNVIAYVPHGVLRYNAMGGERRAPTDAELQQMREQLDEGMRAGAIGMSTGLVYAPGTFAQTDELVALAKVAAQYGGIYGSHIRNESERLLEAVGEAISIGEQAGCGVQISHHKAAGAGCFGMTKESLPFIAAARARGVDVTIDVYPYVASSSSLAAMFRLGRGAAFEQAPAIIASVKYNKERYEGKYVRDIAADLDLPIPRRDPQGAGGRREYAERDHVHHGRSRRAARRRRRARDDRLRRPAVRGQAAPPALRDDAGGVAEVRARRAAADARRRGAQDDVAAGAEASHRASAACCARAGTRTSSCSTRRPSPTSRRTRSRGSIRRASTTSSSTARSPRTTAGRRTRGRARCCGAVGELVDW